MSDDRAERDARLMLTVAVILAALVLAGMMLLWHLT